MIGCQKVEPIESSYSLVDRSEHHDFDENHDFWMV